MKKTLSILSLAIILLTSCGKEEPAAEKKLPAFKTIKGIDCVLIKAGSFIMGASETDEEAYDDETPQHNVTITKDFYLGQYEVTNAQYCEFLNAKKIGEGGKYKTKNDGEQVLVVEDSWGVKYADGQWIPYEGYEDFPVVCVSWSGADEFCRWAGGKLPTEAQWEYACRAGSSSAYFWGDSIGFADKYAWWNNNSEEKTHKVGLLLPNPWGLYDINGNVFEWCSDWYDEDFYSNCPREDPEQTLCDYANKVLRGGDYYSELGIRVSYRDGNVISAQNDDIGFRFCYIP